MKEKQGEVLKIMLVDDEQLTLTKLKMLMNYEEHGFLICGEASSARSAIELIERQPPDILFTDMNMPAMDGVALIRYIKENLPDIIVVAISGYEDFNYVYQGLQSGAVDYLLKHTLTQERMTELLKKIRIQIEKERDSQVKERVYQSRITAADKIVENEGFRRLLFGEQRESGGECTALAKLFTSFYMILFEMDEYRENLKIDQALVDFMDKIFSESGTCRIFPVEKGMYVVLVTFLENASEQSHYEALFHSMRRTQNSALRFLNISLSCCKSGLMRDFTRIGEQFKYLKTVMERKFYLGSGKIMEARDNNTTGKEFSYPAEGLERELWINALKTELLSYLNYAETYLIVPGELKTLCKNVIEYLLNTSAKWGVQERDLYLDIPLPVPDMDDISSKKELEQYLMKLFDNCESAISITTIHESVSPKAAKALSYIHKNFDKPISLDSVAEAVGLSEAYLSRMFKEETGKGVTEYLKEIRIIKAKQLLEFSSFRIKDICKMSGFNDYGYFIKAFKAGTGKTPVEYRQKESK